MTLSREHGPSADASPKASDGSAQQASAGPRQASSTSTESSVDRAWRTGMQGHEPDEGNGRHSSGREPLESDELPHSTEAVGDPDIIEQVHRAQEGSAHAFASLYDYYADQVFAFVYHRVGHRQTAEDLVGDVFLRALRRIETFRWQGVDFGAWLMTIARNRVNDHFKSARFRLEAPVGEVFESPNSDGRDDPEHAAMSNDLATHVHEALSQLKGEQAEVLYLRFIQHLNVAETGAVMGKSEGAVKALQYRALKSLARLVPDELTEP